MIPDTNFLSVIQNAIVNKNILHLAYQNINGEQSSRQVEPIGLTFYSLNWHMIAWCHLRQEYRDFRTSRILDLRPSLMPFRKTDHISMHEYIREIDQTVEKEFK